MSVELRPLGVACNIQCQYCYQNPQRDTGNVARSYDVERMKGAVDREGGPFTLFGGEPLLTPKDDLEELWRWGFERYGRNGIQTNGALIDDDHVRMFREYGVQVGISIDGPGELNDVRWAGSLEATRRATARTEAAIERLCAEGMAPSLIVTLHRHNASPERLPLLHDWFRRLEAIGVRWARLHLLEVDHDDVSQKYELTTEQNVGAMVSFAALEQQLTTLRFDVFDDMRKLLAGSDEQTTCIWNGCDPYTTAAVRGIEGNGQSSNCGRTNKEGIEFVKSDREGFERYLALYQTPYEHGGCQGCRFFLMCKGQCPGTAIDGDWRNRSAQCEVWLTLFERLEADMVTAGTVPLSLSEERPALEQRFLDVWSTGRGSSIAGLRVVTHGDVPHGDA